MSKAQAIQPRLITFDALDTLYRFREPFANQYLKVARRCGYQVSAQPEQLDKAFKAAFKDLAKQYPNYGKGKLAHPQEWWASLIGLTFQKVTNGAPMPSELTGELYRHFSSAAAYELFPEVESMFLRLRKTRAASSQGMNGSPDPFETMPQPITGVISNSDPRVIGILRDLGLKVGEVEPQQVQDGRSSSSQHESSQVVESDWDPNNDIDFVCTSYEAGSEKPDKGIFDHALALASAVAEGMTQPLMRESNVVKALSGEEAKEFYRLRRTFVWQHVGDDFKKDFQGAKNGGAANVYLVRHHQLAAGTTSTTDDELVETEGGKLIIQDLNFIWQQTSQGRTNPPSTQLPCG